ncbi:MAG: Holliday junction branch migration DNA helicase RuvB [Candidatus Pacebacteria bacterium]|nr:Holliday junction branch migration DNA helicase RuvB [Candidatus Paceibacterota bacterium]PIR60680.1 MAG: Holliday junction branch migration DNA helicase RuvB [Candidatus Pacebacteria bacterium CG10_big_fil_rev_8_21_14_0_10_44_54]
MTQAPSQLQTPEEVELFSNLRAQTWAEFYGQDTVKKSLTIAIEAARNRAEPLDHLLLYGPPGLGKTTLCHLIASELNVQTKITSGTALTKVGDLAAIITNLNPGDILFIDEIHRLPKAVEETLYPAMEDYALDVVIGKGPTARSIRLDLPKFTLVGATTKFGLLSGPFRDRFGIIHRLSYYKSLALQTILMRSAEKLHVRLRESGAIAIAQRSRGTPRIALKLLKRVRDYLEVHNQTEISGELVQKALDLFEIDQLGLDDSDRRLIELIIGKHQGGPVGLSTLAAALNEDTVTIEEVIEPYLMQIGFLKRTTQGRMTTEAAKKHLNNSNA